MVSVGTMDGVSGARMLRVISETGITIEVERPVSESELAAIITALTAS